MLILFLISTEPQSLYTHLLNICKPNKQRKFCTFMTLSSVPMCSKYTVLISCVDLFKYQTTKSPYICNVQQILNKMIFTPAIKSNKVYVAM